jgi:hypothetical protein
MAKVPDFMVGTITKVLDPHLYTIEFTVEGVIEGGKAFPFIDIDEPVVGNEVFLITLDSVYGTTFMYKKMKKNTYIGMTQKGKEIRFTDSDIISTLIKYGQEIDNLVKTGMTREEAIQYAFGKKHEN